MADAVLWQILNSIKTGITNDLSLVAQGGEGTGNISSSRIYIRKSSPRSLDNNKNYRGVTAPALIITAPSSTVRNPYEGTNERDDVRYNVLIQIIGRDSGSLLTGLRTYLKWQEQLGKYFNCSGRDDVMTSDGWVTMGWVKSVDNIDETDWTLDSRFVSGVMMEFISREPRGITS